MGERLVAEHSGCCGENEFFWYIEERSNLLVRVDLNNFSTMAETLIHTYNTFGYRAIGIKKDTLYLIPFYDDSIVARKKNGEIIKREVKKGFPANFNGCYCGGEHIYLFGNQAEICKLSYDMQDLQMIDGGMLKDDDKEDVKYGTDAFVCDDKLYIPMLEKNSIAVLNLRQDSGLSRIVLGGDNKKWKNANVKYYDGHFYALYQEPAGTYKTAKYDMQGSLINEGVVEFKRDIEIYPHTKACLVDSKWFLLPYNYNAIQVVSVDGGTAVDLPYKNSRNSEPNKLINAYYEHGDKIYAIDQFTNNSLMIFDKKGITVKMVELSIVSRSMAQLMESEKSNDAFITVEMKDLIGIDSFIDYVLKKE